MADLRHINDVTVIKLDAEYDALDKDHLQQVSDLLLGTAEAADPPLIVLDLSSTKYMGSGFLEVLFRSWKRTTARNGRLALCCLQPFCAEVLRVAQLDSMLEIFASVDEAVAAFRPA